MSYRHMALVCGDILLDAYKTMQCVDKCTGRTMKLSMEAAGLHRLASPYNCVPITAEVDRQHVQSASTGCLVVHSQQLYLAQWPI